MKSIEQQTQKAWSLYQDLTKIGKNREMLLWHEAELLYKLKVSRLYKSVFGIEERENVRKSWRWFLREINYSPNTADFKTKLYEKWVIDLGYSISDLCAIQTRKLYVAIPYAITRKKSEEIIEQAKVLLFDDFFLWLKGGKEPCWHLKTKKTTKEIRICEECGKECKNLIKQ